MKDFFIKIWDAVTSYPDSFDDYVGVGRWLIYKKLLVLLAVLLTLAAALLVWWLSRPEPPFALPVFYEFADELKPFSGEAILTDKDENVVYRGQIAAGVRSGRGRQLALPNEALVYEGDFLDGLYSGRGTLYMDGATVYEGGFLEGLYSGTGKLYDGDALVYAGQFLQGLYSGEGVLYQAGKPLYEGGFLNGRYDGNGTLYNKEGAVIYTGGFAKGSYSGDGVLTRADGTAVYEGSFLEGLYDGAGRLYAGDGVRLVYQGMFVKGEPGRSGGVYNTQGQLLYEGNVFDGGVDYIGLLGLPVAELQKQVKELPTIYYDVDYVGYLYRELGFAVITKYDYAELGEADAPKQDETQPSSEPEPAPAADKIELFAMPADNLVVNTLLVEGSRFYEQLPDKEAESMEDKTLTGFEAFMESRLARVRRPTREPEFAVEAAGRGDHLYEVTGVPEKVDYDGHCLFKASIYYYYRTDSFDKGSVPEVIVCKKGKFGE